LTLMLRHLPLDRQRTTCMFPQRVDGVILFGVAIEANLAAYLRALPCVGVMGQVDDVEPWDRVTYANEPIGCIAASFLRQRGHRHAAVITAAADSELFKERADVFSKAWAGLGGITTHHRADAALLINGAASQRIDPARLRAVLDDVLSSAHPPTGFFLTADLLAGPAQAEFLRRGLVLGRDIDLIACNNERLLLDHLHPCPATIDIHASEIGQRAASHLLWRITHAEEPRQTVLIEPQLVPGDPDTNSVPTMSSHRSRQPPY
jgi:DNA-binding LacI/PurR family transcriptional regulator